jgi:trans-aconitate 2-methyltransferase
LSDWNPKLYLKFEKERTQPVKDLLARIDKANPARIIDIGCGPGNSTLEIKKRFPEAEIEGLDNSPAMIEKARVLSNEIKWVLGDALGDLSELGRFDIVFSNAAIQWMPDHQNLLRNLFGLLDDGGVLAVQAPQFEDMPVSGVIKEVSSLNKWKEYFSGFHDGMYYFNDHFYYDTLCGLSHEISLWVTKYYHVMQDHAAIIDWINSTALRPYIDRLPLDVRGEFTEDILIGLKGCYQTQTDGSVLFPFKRLFFIVGK